MRYWLGDPAPDDTEAGQIYDLLASYTEVLLVERYEGSIAAEAYLEATCAGRNRGAAHLHLLRRWIDNDDRWFEALRGLPHELQSQHLPLSAANLASYLQWQLGENVLPLLKQYLTGDTPLLAYSLRKKGRKTTFAYRWEEVDHDFFLPVDLWLAGEPTRFTPRHRWQSLIQKGLSTREVRFAPAYCVYNLQETDRP
ncbi:MAG: hypothetical protein D6722_10650 [Bacteroidetes bacterium]|nr:MAG: hypothetical protein D6722_10650 [Bacteroidota bacterium]